MEKIYSKNDERKTTVNDFGSFENRHFVGDEINDFDDGSSESTSNNVNNNTQQASCENLGDITPKYASNVNNEESRQLSSKVFDESFSDNSREKIPDYASDNFDDNVPESASQAFEIILQKVRDYNCYQWRMMFITGFCGLFTSFHNMGAVFLAATPDHWCQIPYLEEHNISQSKSSLKFAVPWVRGKNGLREPSKCSYYHYSGPESLGYSGSESFSYSGSESLGYSGPESLDYDHSVTDSVENLSPTAGNLTTCSSWVFEDRVFESTAVTEWNLVCDDKWLMSSIQASYMVGILVGAVVFSILSDKMGRRPSSLICSVLFFACSLSAVFVRSFSSFLLLRFVVAASGQGMFLSNYILLMETVSLKGRNVMGNTFHLPFSVGFALLSLLAYLIRDWRNLQLVLSAPTCLLLGYYWLLPESPRWLLMQGKEKEGIEVLKSIAKTNDVTFPSDEKLKPLLRIIENEVKSKNVITSKGKLKSIFNMAVTLVRTPNMRKRNLIIFYAWFVTAMTYYGISFSGSNLDFSLYTSVALSAIVEIPAVFFTVILLSKFGRRTILSLNFLIGGAACVAIIFIPPEMVALNLVMVNIGKFSVSICFSLVFIFSAELVPTDVRNLSIGVASMWSRIGSAIAPYTLDLLGDVYFAIPFAIFGFMSIAAGLLCLLLPETGDKRMPESIEEIETMPR